VNVNVDATPSRLLTQSLPPYIRACHRLRVATDTQRDEDCHSVKPRFHRQVGWSVPLRILLTTGKLQDAQEHLTIATTMYREMDMTYWLERSSERSKSSGATSYSVPLFIPLLTQDSNVQFAGSLGANLEGP
jgi:hypothetical protein